MPKRDRSQQTARSRGLRGWVLHDAIHSEKVGVYRITVSDPEAVSIGGGFALPRAFTIEPTDESRPLLDVKVDHERATCVAVRAREGAPLTTTSVRQPVDAFVKSAVYVLALERLDAPARDRVTGEEISAGTWVHVHRRRDRDEHDRIVRERRRGVALSDTFLADVARVYREGIELKQPPTQLVADELYGSRSSAGRWVMEARRRGFLPPTERRKVRA